MADRTQEPVRTNPLLLAVAWAVVSIPTAWGLSYTVQSALKIFASAPATPVSTAAPALPAANH
jgi:hypothetical protein